MGWIEELLAGRHEEERLQGVRLKILATQQEARDYPDRDTKVRLESLRRSHYNLTGCGGPS